LCTPRNPDCRACPVALDCVARRQDRQHELPTPRPRKKLPEKSECFVIARDRDDRVLMLRRAPSGIWGGLWCLPEADRVDAACVNLERATELPAPAPIRHTFTHFRLDMRFVHVRLADHPVDPGRLIPPALNDADDWRWMSADDWTRAGLPRPIRAVLGTLVSG
ncbi:MAG: NUDIX domain-containing protein, partial [Wenzhouxiangellaceae bacterium]